MPILILRQSSWRTAFALLLVFFSEAGHALTFEEALRLAGTQAPQIKAQAANIASAESSSLSAGQLPDPKLEVGIENLPVSGPEQYSLTQDFMTMRKIGLMQDFPNGEKRKAQAEAAREGVVVAERQMQIERLAAMRGAASAWIERDTVERQLQFADALLEENRLFNAAVRADIAAGNGSLADGIIPRQEAVSIENLRSDLLARREKAVAELERWIGKAGGEPLTGAAPDLPIDRDMLSHALHHHPELEIFDSRDRKLDAEISEAKAEKIPDWGVELAYQERAPQFGNMASFQFTIALPVFPESRQDPRIAAKIAEKEALDAEREATFREHNAMLESDLAEYRRLTDMARRQEETLIPLSEERVRLTMAAWRGGKSGLAEVSSARRERIETKLKAIELEGSRELVAVRLHYTMLPGVKP